MPAPKRKGRPGLCPATASTPSRWNRLTQRSMVRELQNKKAATVVPGVASGQEQQDVGTEADLGVGVLAISVEQRLALPGVEGHATGHGCKYQRCELSWSTQLYRPRLLSLLRGSI